jgi:hypothetical protein
MEPTNGEDSYQFMLPCNQFIPVLTIIFYRKGILGSVHTCASLYKEDRSGQELSIPKHAKSCVSILKCSNFGWLGGTPNFRKPPCPVWPCVSYCIRRPMLDFQGSKRKFRRGSVLLWARLGCVGGELWSWNALTKLVSTYTLQVPIQVGWITKTMV